MLSRRSATPSVAVTRAPGLLRRSHEVGVCDPDAYVDAVMEREEEGGGTGMEMGVAIRHGESSGVERASVAFARSAEGVDFGGDGGASRPVFLIAAPTGSEDLHVRLLAKLARRLVHESFRNNCSTRTHPRWRSDIIRDEVTL